MHPQRALSRGIEGHVLVQFTIDELGRVVNGEPIPVSGVQHRLSFQLDG